MHAVIVAMRYPKDIKITDVEFVVVHLDRDERHANETTLPFEHKVRFVYLWFLRG